MELPLRAGTTRRTALSGSEGLELSGADCGDERSDYELQRARSIRLNKEFLHSQQMIANVVDEADAVLVTKKWWSRSHATKPSLNSVVSAIDDAGFQGQRRTAKLPIDLMYGTNQMEPNTTSEKLHHPWKGPFKVMERLGETTYKIKNLQGSREQEPVGTNLDLVDSDDDDPVQQEGAAVPEIANPPVPPLNEQRRYPVRDRQRTQRYGTYVEH
eukprot:Em0006g842a